MDDHTTYIDVDQVNSIKVRREKPPRPQKPRVTKAPPPALPIREAIPYASATFNLISSLTSAAGEDTKLRPRLGRFTLQRDHMASSKSTEKASHHSKLSSRIEIHTPGMLCGTRRGMVKHLSRDNLSLAKGAEWIHTPLEDFLEHPIPIPAYHPSPLPLHGFLTHPPSSHIISLSLRNLHDNQNMPANTNIFVQARTVRGVRKVGIDDWITWCKALRPDLVWALVDAPKTLTGMGDPDSETPDTGEVIPGEGRQTSQKRTMKSMDRSWLWVEKLVRDLTLSTGPSERLQGAISTIQSRPPIIVPLVGGCDPRARAEFSRGLVDKLDVPIVQSDDVALKRIEEGIIGYAIELVDLPSNALITPPSTTSTRSSSQDENNPEEPNAMLELLRASFDPLDNNKLRIAHSAPSPHVILRLIGEAGMDLFESPWLAEAADLGISLNFQFPAPVRATQQGMSISIGQNLFEEHFSMDFEPIGELDSSWPCHPMYSNHHTLHGRLDSEQWKEDVSGKKSAFEGFTRAYVHHLLHTHEMGAYALLHLHNLAVMDRFFEGIRSYMSQNADSIDFTKEVLRFYETYDLPGPLFDEARRRWKEVEDARGKGSLKREREVLNNVQGAEGVPVFAVDDANPRIGMPKSDATAVLEEAIEDRV